MALPPARTELADTYPNPSNATFRTGIGKLWDYVTGLLGSTGGAAEARAALGVPALYEIGLPNLLINSAFIENQLGVSGTVTLTAGNYGHDMWKAGASGCTYTFSKVNGATTITITAGSLQQVIEGDGHLFAGTHILCWTGTAQGKIGTGSYGASGVTAAVTGGANLTIEFGTGTVSKPHFRAGTAVLPWSPYGGIYGGEKQACQRYFQKVYAYRGIANQPNNIQVKGQYFVPMRAAPTVSLDSANIMTDTQANFAQSSANVSTITGHGDLYYQLSMGNYSGLTVRQIYDNYSGALLFSARL